MNDFIGVLNTKTITTKTGRKHFEVSFNGVPIAMILDVGEQICEGTIYALCVAAVHYCSHTGALSSEEHDIILRALEVRYSSSHR